MYKGNIKDIKIIQLKEIDSSNNWIKNNIKNLDPMQITCVISEEQTGGRGRFDRKWFSPKGGLYCSFYFTIPPKKRNLENLSNLLSQSAHTVIKSYKIDVKTEYPNDLTVNGKKIAGVLCEIIDQKHVILGIGININIDKDTIKNIDQKATSFLIEKSKVYSIKKFLTELIKEFLKNI